ncbi:MAG TPA: hypothetical protein VIM70_12400 [Clostridium sp.]|uniref:hypothetical protein n=1 Tax=Clostridium sp. TaxID=1506 RepID=UPI002F9493BB
MINTIKEISKMENIEKQQEQVKKLNLPKHLFNLASGYCALCNQEIIFHTDNSKEKIICIRWINEQLVTL